MRVIQMTGYGGPEVVKLSEAPLPTPAQGEIRIKVKAAALNPVDYKIRKGLLKAVLALKFPQIMGCEAAGVVDAVGEGVTGFKEGDGVFTRLDTAAMAGFADYVCVDHKLVAARPRTVSFEDAAGVPLVALTAWQALFEVAELQPGHRVFVHGGGGSVGYYAIQLAKNHGAYVATSASGRSWERVSACSPDKLLNYKEDDVFNPEEKYDVVLDTVGEDTLINSFNMVKPGGTIVSIAGAPDPQTADALGANLLVKCIFWLLSAKPRKLAKKAQAKYRYMFMHADGGQLGQIAAAIDAGKLKTCTDRTYALEDFEQAFDRLESGQAAGKVVLQIS